MTQYGTWVPYAGSDAVLLGVTLLAVAVVFVYLGMRLKRSVGVKRPGKAVSVFMILMWALSLVTFLVAVVTYGLQLYQEHMLSATPTNPITPITELCGLVTFIIIAYLARSHGLKDAPGRAFVGTAAAPMTFELPFDLIVMSRTYPPYLPHQTCIGFSFSYNYFS